MIHGELPTSPADLWNHWPVRPSIVLPLVAAVLVYAKGVRNLWAHAGVGRVLSRRRVAAFGAGCVALAVALLSPLDPLGEVLFSAHMTQHLLLILVAAPLLVAGSPEVAAMWALPARARRGAGRWGRALIRARDQADGSVAASLFAVATATAVLWVWHVPSLYDLAIRSDAVHAAEHGTFLLTSLVFWATVLRLGRRARARNGVGFLLMFAMAVQGSILGALITFASRPLYGAHAVIAEPWGLSPLADQQLAGLIMWVPPALLYIVLGAYLFVRWLQEIERRSTEREGREARRGRGSGATAGAGTATGTPGAATG